MEGIILPCISFSLPLTSIVGGGGGGGGAAGGGPTIFLMTNIKHTSTANIYYIFTGTHLSASVLPTIQTKSNRKD